MAAKKKVKKAKKAPAKKAARKSSVSKKNSKGVSGIGLTPLGDKVLIRLFDKEEEGTTLPSGIIIPATVDKDKGDRGEVVAVGPGRTDDHGHVAPIGVSVGDKVLFQWGDKIEYGGKEYYLVGSNNILAVIN